MKQTLITVTIALCFVLAYMTFTTIVIAIASPDFKHPNVEAAHIVNLPIALPNYIYYKMNPELPTPGAEGRWKRIGLNVVANTFLYAVLFHFLWAIFAKRRKKFLATKLIHSPPPPPTFNNN